MEGPEGKLTRILSVGEERLSEVISILLDNDGLTRRMEGISKSRARLMDTISSVRGMIGLPSHGDLQTLEAVLARSGRKLSDLRSSLARLESNLDTLRQASQSELKQALRSSMEQQPEQPQTKQQPEPKAAAAPKARKQPLSTKDLRVVQPPPPVKAKPKAATPKAVKPKAAKSKASKPVARPSKASAVVSLTGQPLVSKPRKRKGSAAKSKSSGMPRSTMGLTSIDLRKIKGR
ncbi:MAG: hypothetical protein P9M14_14600 [Candidatus Alcyoniella australis]|nr:hypothetical protein [Candidatus Alcyoniella australis]